MADMLAGKIAVVLGGAAVGEAITSGLAKLGAIVFRSVAETSGAADLVVIPVVDPGGLTPAPLAEMDEAEWIRRCEAPLKAMRSAMQTAYAALSTKGGRMFLLVPTISMVGAAGFAPFSAVGEGARSLAKAAARSWGAQGVTVNCLALTPEQLAPGEQGNVTAKRVPQALGRTPELETDIAAFIATLSVAPGIVTGATISLDGGNLMSV
jgi:3-oxoacyl-[acyl-carrier protein] reductase